MYDFARRAFSAWPEEGMGRRAEKPVPHPEGDRTFASFRGDALRQSIPRDREQRAESERFVTWNKPPGPKRRK